jgi:ankyrin repeat protein
VLEESPEILLFHACDYGQLNLVQYLMGTQDIPHEAINAGPNAGMTPLFIACSLGHQSVVEYLDQVPILL